MSSFALKANLASLKTEVEKLDIDKLVPVPVYLSKLSDAVKIDVVKKSILRCLTLNSKWITEWKSKGLSNERLEVVSKTDNTLTPSVNYYEDKVRLRFTGTVLQEKTITYSHKS